VKAIAAANLFHQVQTCSRLQLHLVLLLASSLLIASTQTVYHPSHSPGDA
jgi:hypothetical protein